MKLAVTPAFGWFWIARTASLMGDYAFRVGFITYLIRTSGSPNVLAEATAVLLVPAIAFYLFGGALGDRARSRRAVLVGSDLLRVVGTAAAALAVAVTGNPLPVVGFALLIGVGAGFFEPIAAGFLTQIVNQSQLVQANSALSVSRQVSLIVGPILGGALVGWTGPAAAFWFDAASFAVSALALLAIPATTIVAAPSGRTRRGHVAGPVADRDRAGRPVHRRGPVAADHAGLRDGRERGVRRRPGRAGALGVQPAR